MDTKRFEIISSPTPRFKVISETGEAQVQAVQLDANSQVAIAELQLKQNAIEALSKISEQVVNGHLELVSNQKERQSVSATKIEYYLQQVLLANKEAETTAAMNGLVTILTAHETSEVQSFKNSLMDKVVDILSTVLM